MKKRMFFIAMFFSILLTFSVNTVTGQENQVTKKSITNVDEEDSPIVFKFEPELLLQNEQRKTAILEARKTIDTMNISDRKRYRLLKALYRNTRAQSSKKELLADVKFEDVVE